MAVGDVWRLSMVGDWAAGETAVTTAHVRMKSGAGTFDGAAAYFKTNLLTLYKGAQPNTFNWRYINGLLVNQDPPQAATYTTGFPITGLDGGQSVPYTVAVVASLRTNYAGRSYRGRMYLPALSENSSDGGRILAATVNVWQGYFDDLIAGIGYPGSNPDYEWGVWSRKLNIFTPYSSVIVRNVPGTIRRRRPGVGS